ncbi:MAG: nucleotidyltransferase family protein [Phycisphaerae bacterium]|nr:nucleotidyltransferase family protein [Phycisphaerae bacterium]
MPMPAETDARPIGQLLPDRADMIERIRVQADASILEAMRAINDGACEIAIVVDGGGRLVGLLSDGDIRRAILNGFTLESPISDIVNRRPLSMPETSTRDELLAVMGRHSIRQIPLVDEQGRVSQIAWITDLIRTDLRPNQAVIMAGGKGKRLYPLTRDVPKPMLEVRGRPIIEHLIDQLRQNGIFRITLAVNHLRDVIKDHFQGGERFGVRIEYLEEEPDHPLGTAGALGLLTDKPSHPFLLLNGDLMQQVNFNSLLAFHERHDFQATMCAVRYSMELPFGLIEVDGNRLTRLVEKPVHTVNSNAGIYVLNPGVLDWISANESCDATDLLQQLVDAGKTVGVFTLYDHEHWLDVGRKGDYDYACHEYPIGPDQPCGRSPSAGL